MKIKLPSLLLLCGVLLLSFNQTTPILVERSNDLTEAKGKWIFIASTSELSFKIKHMWVASGKGSIRGRNYRSFCSNC